MKKTIEMMVLAGMMFLSFCAISSQAQTRVEITSKVTPLPLTVGMNHTTNLIFPYAIKSVDKGSREILVQKAKGVENVLQVKASSEHIQVTNLTVITADGQLYSFLVGYEARPANLNIELGLRRAEKSSEVIFSSSADNEASRDAIGEQVALKKRSMKAIMDSRYDITLRLVGLYIHNDLLYFQLELENISNINYSVDQLRFFIRDQKKAKRTASQELEIIPQQIKGNHTVVRSNSRNTIVAVIPKLTIPDKKYLAVQLVEAGGGRHLSIRISNKHLIRSKLL